VRCCVCACVVNAPCRHFEITNCFTKLALMCVVQFMHPGSVAQILATLALALVSVLLYSILHPMGSLLAQSWKVLPAAPFALHCTALHAPDQTPNQPLGHSVGRLTD